MAKDTTTTEETVLPGVSEALRESLAAFDPGTPDRSVLRFDIDFKQDDPGTIYSYVAIWTNGKWHVSGVGTVFARDGEEHAPFMQKLAKWKAFNVELATGFDTIR